jgi:hypothetical protein
VAPNRGVGGWGARGHRAYRVVGDHTASATTSAMALRWSRHRTAQTLQTPDPGIKHCMPVIVCISPDAMSVFSRNQTTALPNLLGPEITA